MLKFIIHIKRFIAAFFVTVLIKPLAWIARLAFDLFLVPIYRLYVRGAKKIEGGNKVSGSTVSHFLNGRFNIHIFIGALALILCISNLVGNQSVASSDELVGRTKLSRLVVSGDVEREQLIEDYPNLEIAKLERRFGTDTDVMQIEGSILTKEEPEVEAGPALAERSETVIYTVQSGDTISSIARRFGVSVNTVLWENNLTATSLIKPGIELSILPSSGISHTITRGQTLGQIAALYGVSSDDILTTNNLANPNQLQLGAKIIIPGGSRLAVAAPTRTTARQASSGIIGIIQNNKPSALIPSGGRMVWPTSGYRITQYFSSRHTGLDIANKIGTPIYAADAGTVVTVGYNRGGYGNQIVINHGGGKQTRYAHLSSFDVRVGNKVTKGQYIGAMGSTGRSTGPHLHFEVLINGNVYNPLNYIR